MRCGHGLQPCRRRVRLGIALDDLDYVEYPYELLACNAEAAARADASTGVLHCASLSLASGHPRDLDVVHAIAEWAERMDSPWIGEHLAFIDAEVPSIARPTDEAKMLYDIGFAVSPPLNAATVEIVATALAAVGSVTDRPFAIENSPIYLPMPGSTMGQGEAFTHLAQLVDIRLLVDLAHLLITCDTFGLDPLTELHRFPLDRVVEVHLSGVSRDSGVLWDDHASAPPPRRSTTSCGRCSTTHRCAPSPMSTTGPRCSAGTPPGGRSTGLAASSTPSDERGDGVGAMTVDPRAVNATIVPRRSSTTISGCARPRLPLGVVGYGAGCRDDSRAHGVGLRPAGTAGRICRQGAEQRPLEQSAGDACAAPRSRPRARSVRRVRIAEPSARNSRARALRGIRRVPAVLRVVAARRTGRLARCRPP